MGGNKYEYNYEYRVIIIQKKKYYSMDILGTKRKRIWVLKLEFNSYVMVIKSQIIILYC